MKVTTNKKEGSMAEILVSLEWADIIKHQDSVLKEIQKDFEIDVFRKRNVPIEMVKKNISEMHVFESCAEYELQNKYIEILKDSKLDAIGRPLVTILKLAENNPVEIKIETAVYPEIKLPDYKKLSKEKVKENAIDKNSFETTDEELTKTFDELRHMRAHQKAHEDGGHGHDDHSHGEITEEMYPELNDEFAKSFGFENIDKMSEKVRENVKQEKAQKHSEKNRIAIMENIIENTGIEIPKILIDGELDQMIQRIRHDISMMGLSFEDYLKHINKNEFDLRTDYENDAKKQVASKLIIEEIAKKENLKAEDKEVELEVEKLMEQYPGSDRPQVTMYIESVLTSEKVFKFLEA